MKILSIAIIKTGGTDIISLETDLPDGCFPYKGNAYFDAKVAHSTGVDYVKKHFPEFTPRIIQSELIGDGSET